MEHFPPIFLFFDSVPLLFHSNFQTWKMRSLPTLDPYVFLCRFTVFWGSFWERWCYALWSSSPKCSASRQVSRRRVHRQLRCLCLELGNKVPTLVEFDFSVNVVKAGLLTDFYLLSWWQKLFLPSWNRVKPKCSSNWPRQTSCISVHKQLICQQGQKRE